MISSRALTYGCTASKRTAARLAPTFNALTASTVGLRPSYILIRQYHPITESHRNFSTTEHQNIKEFFPKKETELVRKTPTAWPHPGKQFAMPSVFDSGLPVDSQFTLPSK